MATPVNHAEVRGFSNRDRAPGSTATTMAGLALLLALVGLAGSLYLSIGMNLKACPLCYYQRTFMMGVVVVLGLGLLADRERAGLLCLLALPLAVGGLGVAAYHEYQVAAGTMICPDGLFGLGPAPLQSLLAFVVLTVPVLVGAWSGLQPAQPRTTLFAIALGLGLVLAWACVASVGGYKPPPEATDICKPVT